MRRLILLVFIGAFLIKNVTSSSIQAYPTNLAWLFASNDKPNENEETTQNVCKIKECENIAKIISESIDSSADPCDDFYEYACGKWAEHNPIPKGQYAWSLFHKLQRKVQQQVDDILKEKSKSSDILALKLAKKWFAVCTDTDAMDKRGLGQLVTTLSRIGGWPMIMDPDEWNEEEYSWQKVDDQYVRLTGKNTFHDVHVNSYSPNKTVQISTPHLPPGTIKLWLQQWFESDEIEDDNNSDPSEEEEEENREDISQVDQGSGSGDGEDDDDDEDDEDDDNSEDNEIDNDREDDTERRSKYKKNKIAKKKINKKKSTDNKLTQKKNTKIQHNKKTKSSTRILNSHKKKQRVKRRATSTKIHRKHAEHLTHREKLRKSKRNHVKKAQDKKRTKKTVETESTLTTPQITVEETSGEDDNDETAQQVYANYISKVARAIAEAGSTEVSEELIDKDIKDLIEFQVKLAEVKGFNEDEELELTLNDFQQWYDEKKPDTVNKNVKINWVYKIAELFDEAHVPVDGDLSLEIKSDYFEALAILLNETPSRTIVNYIHWNFLSRMIETTTNEMRKLYNAWEEWEILDEDDEDYEYEEDEDDEEDEESEEDEEKERSSTCRHQVQLRDILAYEYVKRHFSDDITQTAQDMVDDIQKEVEYQIKESEWLDDDTKEHVFAKLVNMKKYIGYPDWYRNNTIVKRYFQGLILTNSYYENILSYGRYRTWKQLRELKKDNDIDDVWWMSPLTVNAFFDPEANSISLSAADFQSPFFSYGRPQAINYGIVGVIMAHEVNHGFDDSGFFYDKNGNNVNDDYDDNADFVKWLSIMSREYGKRANCFVEQFNDYPIEKNSTQKIPHYGNQTSGENIADTMGLQASFRAYQRRGRECGKPDIVLPGLEEVTNDQLFFLSFANVWCQAVDSKISAAMARMDVHSPGRLRVIGSVSNSEDFARVFNCPVGSKMNPKRKCNIWK